MSTGDRNDIGLAGEGHSVPNATLNSTVDCVVVGRDMADIHQYRTTLYHAYWYIT